MPFDQFLALVFIAASAAFTPGPNNAIAASSGATFGYRATLPHVFGVGLGFPVLIFMVGLFLGEVFQQSVLLRQGLQIAGVLVLLWMAYRTATAGVSGDRTTSKPLTFLQSAGFQWVNPKGWTFAIAVTAQFVSADNPVLTALICAAVFSVMGFSSCTTWTLAGRAMTRFLTSEPRRRAFNLTMAALIALSVVLLFLD